MHEEDLENTSTINNQGIMVRLSRRLYCNIGTKTERQVNLPGTLLCQSLLEDSEFILD